MNRKRRRFTPEQKAEFVRSFRESGLSLNAFSKKVGIGTSVLRKWVRTAHQRSSVSLVRVRFTGNEHEATNRNVIEVALSNGRVIRVPQDFDEKVVTRLVTLLEQC